MTTRGPRILSCGRPIATTAGHYHWCGLTADNENEAVRAAWQMVREGADFVKVMATGGGMTISSNIFEPQFSVAELSAIVREAHRLGRRVSAHSHSRRGRHHLHATTADGQGSNASLACYAAWDASPRLRTTNGLERFRRKSSRAAPAWSGCLSQPYVSRYGA